ncbi:MAG: hypothetical protein IPN82_16125 [Chitinophagaceae bacterium]|nr:hypothetical protein [Chitinophagaceae bacterium]
MNCHVPLKPGQKFVSIEAELSTGRPWRFNCLAGARGGYEKFSDGNNNYTTTQSVSLPL